MGPGGLFARIAQWLANEVIVKGLANNQAFQRFAVRSSQQVKEISKSAASAARSLADNQNVAQMRQESQAFRKQAKDFASALREEIQQAIQKGAQDQSRFPPKRK